jgi:hypothetical protein
MKDYQEIFAEAIFVKAYQELDPFQQAFVDFHEGEYKKYKKKVGEMFRDVLKVERLKYEYKIILQYYIFRVFPQDIQQAITDGLKLAKELVKPITGIGWFNVHIEKWQKQREDKVKNYLLDYLRIPDFDYPWFFEIFKKDQKGELQDHKFNPWWGARETKRKKINLSDAEKLLKYNNELGLKNNAILRTEAFLQKQKLSPDQVAHLRKRLKYLKGRRTLLKKMIKELEG